MNSNNDNKIMTKISSIHYIEHLSNEIFYEIFDYLEDCNIFQSFTNLNIRFEKLLACLSLRLKIKVCHLPTQEKSIQHLHADPNSEQKQDIPFQHYLESVRFIDIKSNLILKHLLILKTFPQLVSLTISIEDDFKNLPLLYKFVFQILSIKYLKISYNQYNPEIPLSLAQPNHMNSIKYLNIDHSCRIRNLMTMLSYTPQLTHLTCRGLIDWSENIEDIIIILPELTHISLLTYFTVWNEFERFIQKISSHVQILRLNIHSTKIHLYAEQWERLIVKYMPNLYRFYFQHHQTFDKKLFKEVDFYDLIKQFYTPFWMEQNWIPKLSIVIAGLVSNQILFSIVPVKKYSNDITVDQRQQMINSNELSFEKLLSKTSPFTKVTIKQNALNCYPRSILCNVIPFFNIIRITHLNLQHDEFYVGLFLDLLHLLPDLESVELKSLMLMKHRKLSKEEENLIDLLRKTNQIIRVTLTNIVELAQIQFLIHLCPRIQQLQISCSRTIDIASLARLVFTKDCNALPHLSILLLSIPKIDYNLTDKLQKMIRSEQGHNEYTIKRVDDQICVQWK
ncbi:hypothetical protein I4U23_020147 [Adineta vaga]|nr:hypothetical protein I4U23_020147 [Adineta vaga]